MNPRGRPATGPDLFVGRIFGIPIYLGPSWFFVALLLTVIYAPNVEAAVAGIGNASYLVSFGFALLLYASVLVHELGHSLVARRFGLPVRRITLHAFVGLSEIEQEPPTPAREALVAAAGPLMSLVIAVLGVLLLPVLAHGTVPYILVLGLVISNAIVAVLNLLPGLPLDGGRVLRAAVWRVSHDPLRGTTAAAWAGRVVGVLIATVGFGWGVQSGGAAFYNIVVSVIVGAFVYTGATAALRAGRLRAVLPGLSARALTRRALPVAADLPLAEALRRLAADGARALVVVAPDGRPTAIVSEAAVSAVPVPRRPWVEVGSLARALGPDLSIPADLAGNDLLQALQAAPAEEYLVVDRDGRVYGVLAAADVAGALTAVPGR